MMEKTCNGQESQAESAMVYEVAGEPAIIINGLPDVASVNSDPVPSDDVQNVESKPDPLFGEWMEGRQVWKLFGNQYYSGKVVEYDHEANWYRVVYEDGDVEDLEWHELEGLLVPLDISVPLTDVVLERGKYEMHFYDSRRKSTKSIKYNIGNSGSQRNASEQCLKNSANESKVCPELEQCDGLMNQRSLVLKNDANFQNLNDEKPSLSGEYFALLERYQTTIERNPNSSEVNQIQGGCSQETSKRHIRSKKQSSKTSRAEKQKRKDSSLVQVAITQVTELPLSRNMNDAFGQQS